MIDRSQAFLLIHQNSREPSHHPNTIMLVLAMLNGLNKVVLELSLYHMIQTQRNLNQFLAKSTHLFFQGKDLLYIYVYMYINLVVSGIYFQMLTMKLDGMNYHQVLKECLIQLYKLIMMVIISQSMVYRVVYN